MKIIIKKKYRVEDFLELLLCGGMLINIRAIVRSIVTELNNYDAVTTMCMVNYGN